MNGAKIDCKFENDELTVVIYGEIDHHSAASLREDIDGHIFFYRAAKVMIDLSQVDFMDSSGLGLILGRYTKIKDIGGSLVIKDPTAEILRILKLSGVEKFIKIQMPKPEKKILKVKNSIPFGGKEETNEKKTAE